MEWAKRGWVCEGWNTVACKGGCEQRVVVILRPKRKDKDGKEIDNSEDMSMEVGTCHLVYSLHTFCLSFFKFNRRFRLQLSLLKLTIS